MFRAVSYIRWQCTDALETKEHLPVAQPVIMLAMAQTSSPIAMPTHWKIGTTSTFPIVDYNKLQCYQLQLASYLMLASLRLTVMIKYEQYNMILFHTSAPQCSTEHSEGPEPGESSDRVQYDTRHPYRYTEYQLEEHPCENGKRRGDSRTSW